MQAVRKILPLEALLPIMELPWENKQLQVEIIVMPIEATTSRDSAAKELKGSLKKYANPSLAKEEVSAWENHIKEKYAAL